MPTRSWCGASCGPMFEASIATRPTQTSWSACSTSTATSRTRASAGSVAKPAAQARASGSDAQLYEAAKGEGQVVLYSSNDVDETQKMIAAFNQKYPGITVKHQRGVRDELTQKALTEFQAKRVSGD